MAGSRAHSNINVNLISAQGNMIFMSHLSMCFESLSLKTAKIFPLLISTIILKLCTSGESLATSCLHDILSKVAVYWTWDNSHL